MRAVPALDALVQLLDKPIALDVAAAEPVVAGANDSWRAAGTVSTQQLQPRFRTTDGRPSVVPAPMRGTAMTEARPRPVEPSAEAGDATAIRPFRVSFPEEELVELRRRVAATRWPERETVADDSQGVPLATMQALAGYWATEHDWRRCEGRLNALGQFRTQIDGLDLHFVHVRSRHADALPLIVTHGWPGSIIEQLKLIGPLTDPTSHGADPADAFDLVIPSLPGHGFSAKPTTTGWDPTRIARAWAVLMGRLGYTRFVAQGGDWGAA